MRTCVNILHTQMCIYLTHVGCLKFLDFVNCRDFSDCKKDCPDFCRAHKQPYKNRGKRKVIIHGARQNFLKKSKIETWQCTENIFLEKNLTLPCVYIVYVYECVRSKTHPNDLSLSCTCVHTHTHKYWLTHACARTCTLTHTGTHTLKGLLSKVHGHVTG